MSRASDCLSLFFLLLQRSDLARFVATDSRLTFLDLLGSLDLDSIVER
jgi:hypothetical protein